MYIIHYFIELNVRYSVVDLVFFGWSSVLFEALSLILRKFYENGRYLPQVIEAVKEGAWKVIIIIIIIIIISSLLSLLYNGYRVFPGGKAAGAWC